MGDLENCTAQLACYAYSDSVIDEPMLESVRDPRRTSLPRAL
ncbi:hypothetical protein [Streptomyces tendae]